MHIAPQRPSNDEEYLSWCRYRGDKQLVSHNIHSATYNYKYTFSVEIVPICKVRTFHNCRTPSLGVWACHERLAAETSVPTQQVR